MNREDYEIQIEYNAVENEFFSELIRRGLTFSARRSANGTNVAITFKDVTRKYSLPFEKDLALRKLEEIERRG